MITADDIKEKRKEYDSAQLQEAVSIQNTLQYYLIPFTDPKYAPDYHSDFQNKIRRKIANKNAFNTFRENTTYPLPTVEFANTIFTSLSKLWDGDGKNMDFIPEEGYTKDFPKVDYFKDYCWERYQIAPNTLIITNQKDDKAIYNRYIDITTVKYLEIDEDLKPIEVLYEHYGGFIWIDAESVIALDVEFKIIEDESMDHGFGFCPVDFISNRKLSYTKPLVRINPLVTSLGDFEELLTVSILANVINKHIVPYVVEMKKTGDAAGCQYRVGSTYCQNGYMYQSAPPTTDGTINHPVSLLDVDLNAAKCPVCNTETGYGSKLDIPALNLSADEYAQVSENIISFKSLGAESLEYPDKKKRELETEIYNKIVNKQDSLNNAQQHNEIRVQSTKDDQLTVIFREKGVFEELMESVITKAIKIQMPSYIKTEVSLGNKFFLKSGAEYQERIKLNKENGNNDLLDDESSLIEVNYSENQTEKGRNLFILQLEKAGKPMRDLTKEQVVGLYKDDSILDKDFDLNVNFYVRIREVEMDKGEKVQNMFPEDSIDNRIKKVLALIKNTPSVNSSTATIIKTE